MKREQRNEIYRKAARIVHAGGFDGMCGAISQASGFIVTQGGSMKLREYRMMHPEPDFCNWLNWSLHRQLGHIPADVGGLEKYYNEVRELRLTVLAFCEVI